MVMYMRARFVCIAALLCAVIMLASCIKTINSPADELQMYSWSGESENGTVVSLTFDGSNGDLNIEYYGDSDLKISGLCIVSDDSLIICDEVSGANYTFNYTLHGDRVELSYNGSTLTLLKNKQE